MTDNLGDPDIKIESKQLAVGTWFPTQSARGTAQALRAHQAYPAKQTLYQRLLSFLYAQELTQQKDELLSKVATLKKELQDWRTKLDTQVKTYRAASFITEGIAG